MSSSTGLSLFVISAIMSRFLFPLSRKTSKLSLFNTNLSSYFSSNTTLINNISNPTYEEVCTGRTLHTEMVEINFNPALISYESLCREFWVMHDPTSLNRQGGDIGTQYRSSIFFTNNQQRDIAFATRDVYQSALTRDGIGEIVTEILDATGVVFYPAEQYHQRYLEKNPNGYDCHSSTGTAFPL